jgi:ABC-type multidrug transport system fused ATPase/permease subunit
MSSSSSTWNNVLTTPARGSINSRLQDNSQGLASMEEIIEGNEQMIEREDRKQKVNQATSVAKNLATKAVKQVAKKATLALLANPITWAVLIIILYIVFLLVIVAYYTNGFDSISFGKFAETAGCAIKDAVTDETTFQCVAKNALEDISSRATE